MPALTYHNRLQLALRESALEDKANVLYADLVNQIRGQFAASDTRYGPYYRSHIFRAVAREVRARRITFDLDVPGRLNIMPSGLRFYKELGTIPLYGRDDPRLQHMSIRQLRHDTRALRVILDEIVAAFMEYRPQEPVPEHGKTLVDAVFNLYDEVEGLEIENGDISVELNYQTGEKRRLLESGNQ